jgi:hypothetical protein
MNILATRPKHRLLIIGGAVSASLVNELFSRHAVDCLLIAENVDAANRTLQGNQINQVEIVELIDRERERADTAKMLEDCKKEFERLDRQMVAAAKTEYLDSKKPNEPFYRSLPKYREIRKHY